MAAVDATAPPTTTTSATSTHDLEEEAYEGILSALDLLGASQRRRIESVPKRVASKGLQAVALDLERAEVLPRGTIYGLQKLNNTDHFFLRRSTERSIHIPEMKRRLELLNASGERLFLATEETTELVKSFSYSSLYDMDYHFMDPDNGMETFRVSSRTRFLKIFGTVISVLKGKNLLGRIVQTGHFGSTVFKLYSVTGRLIYIIKPTEDYVEEIRPSFFQRLKASDDIDIEFPSDFNILSADESVLVGKISGNWNVHNRNSKRDEEESESDESSSDDDDTSEDLDESEIPSDQGSVTSSGVSTPSQSGTTTAAATVASEPFRVSEDQDKSCVPFDDLEADRRAVLLLEARFAKATQRFSTHYRKFNPSRYQRFLETVDRRIQKWEWYFEGENFGAEFDANLGSISRAMIIAVLLVQFFRIHSDRFHRRKSSRISFEAKFRRRCIISAAICISALCIVILDYYREGKVS